MSFAKLIYQYEFIKLNGLLRETLADNGLLFLGLAALWIVISYFLGALNFAIIFSKCLYQDDIRKYGSGNAGFTNMRRTYGTKVALLVFACDIMKTVVGVGGGILMFGANTATLAGLACILGHCFPCYYRFKGGKGIAAAAAMIFVLDPILFLIILAIFAVIVIGTKYLSLASIMSMVLYPILHNTVYNYIHGSLLPDYFIRHGLYTEVVTLNGAVTPVTDFVNTLKHTASPVMVIVAVFIAAFTVFMHRSNIRRMMDGNENRFYLSKKQKAADEAKLAKAAGRHSINELDSETDSAN